MFRHALDQTPDRDRRGKSSQMTGSSSATGTRSAASTMPSTSRRPVHGRGGPGQQRAGAAAPIAWTMRSIGSGKPSSPLPGWSLAASMRGSDCG